MIAPGLSTLPAHGGQSSQYFKIIFSVLILAGHPVHTVPDLHPAPVTTQSQGSWKSAEAMDRPGKRCIFPIGRLQLAIPPPWLHRSAVERHNRNESETVPSWGPP
jgi:hypothetical protein